MRPPATHRISDPVARSHIASLFAAGIFSLTKYSFSFLVCPAASIFVIAALSSAQPQTRFYFTIIEPFRICFFWISCIFPKNHVSAGAACHPAAQAPPLPFCARKHLPGNLNALPFHISRRRFPVQPDSLIHALRTHAVGQADHTADLSCIQCAQFFHMHASDVTAAARHFCSAPSSTSRIKSAGYSEKRTASITQASGVSRHTLRRPARLFLQVIRQFH